jgi:hypothetical protein
MKTHRRIALVAGMASLVAAVVLPAAASANALCPPGFQLEPAPLDEGSVYWADHNGDGQQCSRLLTPSNHLIFIKIDNNFPG